MENSETSPETKTYCVWADRIHRVFQEVEADSPEKAHALAWNQPECWQTCEEHEDNGYRLCDDVQDVATGDLLLHGGRC